MRYHLSRDVTIRFNGGGDPSCGYDVTAKAGAPVLLVPDGMGNPHYAILPDACDAGPMGSAGTWSIFGHDSCYYYVWAPADAVEAVDA